jgi:2-succinyl-5-enolpyruvyl-6-hydroxy-3-cyclohexene-1-carboxylate synthase
MNYLASSLNQLYSKVLIEELFRLGVGCFFISPGSRSAPLVSAVSENSKCTVFTHFDERGSAFAALGFARATNKPVGLICTSGTALANYYPAVVEAYMDRLPLILLTADRPPELQNIGANQTINQSNFYGNYVKNFLNLKPPSKDILLEDYLTDVDNAFYSQQDGPIHINCMYGEPLAPLGKQKNYKDKFKSIKKWTVSTNPFSSRSQKRYNILQHDIEDTARILSNSKKIIIICGYLKKQSDRNAIIKLSEKTNLPIFADTRSGLKISNKSNNLISHYDLLLSKMVNDLDSPFTVLHFGGSVTSKRYLQKIEKSKNIEYIYINDNDFIYNPHRKVTKSLQGNIAGICNLLLPVLKKSRNSKLNDTLKKKNKTISAWLDKHLSTEETLTEPIIAYLTSKNIKPKSILFLGSSMPIRDFDMFASSDGPKISIAANRGASGIDGSISSAFGFATGNKKGGTALIGDLAMLHDLNSLALVKQSKKPIVIVVINNMGGGIFSFLPISRCDDIFEKYFATPHKFNFNKAAKMFGFDYYFPDSPDNFVNIYKKAQNASRSSIIEIQTDRNLNQKYHKKIIQKLSELK